MGLVFSLIVMFFIAGNSEGKDINAISMYYVVFLIPVIVLSLLNVVFLMLISFIKKRSIQLLASFFPMSICIILCQFKALTIPVIDGNLVFLALTGAIALGITNVIWAMNIYSRR